MSRLVMALLAATLAASPAAAARPNTTAMSCGQAAATVARAGAVVLSTGEFTYERFVATGAYCAPGEVTDPGIATTLDSDRCQVGYICRQPRHLNDQ